MIAKSIIGSGRRTAIPRADLLADVAAEQVTADGFGHCRRCFRTVFDGEVRDTETRVQVRATLACWN